MNVSLLVPLAEPQDPVRAAHWSWLKLRWQETLPASWSICEGSALAEPWIKAHAVQAASGAALHGVWVILDADVLLDPGVLIEGAHLVASGEAPWVHPHITINRLAEEPTARVVTLSPATAHEALPLSGLTRTPYSSGPGGGCVILSTDAYLEAGGLDPRFVGWGREDVSFGRALRTLAGPPAELGADLWHLWHPPQANSRSTAPASQTLAKRYVRALDNPEAMRALIAEVQR